MIIPAEKASRRTNFIKLKVRVKRVSWAQFLLRLLR